MTKYEYNITTEETAPTGDARFVAKVNILVRIQDGKAQRLPNPFGETTGATREEAYGKMRKQVQDWIAEQSQ